MSTDVAVRQSDTVSLIQETARNLQAALQIGNALASTIMVPVHFRNKPEECAAAILYGDTIGMDPVTSLQQIHVISGKPGLYARAMVAVVQSKGHEVWTVEAGPTKVIVAGRRKGSDVVETSEWTVERARKAGYTTNRKYDTDPESMLYARSSGDVARRIAPDALLGMAHSIEELELEENNAPEQTAARSSVSRLRAAVAPTEPAAIEAPSEPAREPENIPADIPADPEPEAPADEPAPDELPADAEVVEDPPSDPEPAEPSPAQLPRDPATRAQMNRLQARFMELGCRNRDKRVEVVSKMIARTVASASELTKHEAQLVIDTLDSIASVEVFNDMFGEAVE